MFGSPRRTAAMALLVTTAAGCAGSAPLNPVPGDAPYERELARAASSITPAASLERIWVIAHDSMGGRDTPSPGLDKTAEYFASKYREWGIQPGGDNGTYFQRYPLVRRGVDQAASWLESNENGTITRYPMGTWGYASTMRDAHVSGQVVLLGGALTPEAIAATDLTGKIAFLVEDVGKAADWNRWRTLIMAKQPAAIVRYTNQASTTFRAASTRAAAVPTNWSLGMPVTGIPIIMLHDSVFANDPMRADRPDFGAMRSVTTPVINPIPDVVTLTVHTTAKVYEQTTAPNVVGVIPGSDPVLRNEYVVYSAHMDHVGHRPNPRNPADTIWNGADDDASGSTGILMVAEAFSRLAVKPKRSIIILHVSAEEKGLWGSRWYSENPTVPVESIVANINFDMIGRNNPDSIVVIGKEHSDMGTTLARVNSRHPELRLTTSDDLWPQENFYGRSDHYNFARKGVPILFFFNGTHEDYHGFDDEVEKIDEDKISRVAKMGFFLGAEIANTPTKPAWNPESYRTIVQGPGSR
jgi:hypothetical protein